MEVTPDVPDMQLERAPVEPASITTASHGLPPQHNGKPFGSFLFIIGILAALVGVLIYYLQYVEVLGLYTLGGIGALLMIVGIIILMTPGKKAPLPAPRPPLDVPTPSPQSSVAAHVTQTKPITPSHKPVQPVRAVKPIDPLDQYEHEVDQFLESEGNFNNYSTLQRKFSTLWTTIQKDIDSTPSPSHNSEYRHLTKTIDSTNSYIQKTTVPEPKEEIEIPVPKKTAPEAPPAPSQNFTKSTTPEPPHHGFLKFPHIFHHHSVPQEPQAQHVPDPAVVLQEAPIQQPQNVAATPQQPASVTAPAVIDYAPGSMPTAAGNVQGPETNFDKLYTLLQQKEKLKISTIASTYSIPESLALQWASILETQNLAKVVYPAFGGPVLKIVKK